MKVFCLVLSLVLSSVCTVQAAESVTTIVITTAQQDAETMARTGILRQAMQSQSENTVLDSGEITRSTGLRLPVLPSGWTVRDVQLYPTEGTSAVALSLTTPQGEDVTLLTGRAETPAEGKPLVAKREEDNIAYWEEGDQALALTGAVSAVRALELAALLARG